MSSSRITYAARQDATREADISVLVSIYKLALNSVDRNAPGVTSTKGDNAMKGSNYDRAKDIIPE